MNTGIALGIAAGMAASVLFALRTIYAKKAICEIGAWRALFYICLISWIPGVALYLLGGARPFTPQELYYGAAVGLGSMGGYYLLFKSVEKGLVSFNGAVSELWSVFTVIAAVFFLGESLSPLQFAGIGIAFAGIFYVALKGKLEKGGAGYALGAAIVWGFSWFMVKPLIATAGVPNAFFLYQGIGVVALFLSLLLSGKLAPPVPSVVLPGMLMAGYLVDNLGVMLAGSVSLVSAVYSPTSILALVVFGRIILGERLDSRHYAGMALILAGITAIALGS